MDTNSNEDRPIIAKFTLDLDEAFLTWYFYEEVSNEQMLKIPKLLKKIRRDWDAFEYEDEE